MKLGTAAPGAAEMKPLRAMISMSSFIDAA